MGCERERESCMSFKNIPDILKYQISNDFNINLSDKCCYKLKKEPVHKWQKISGKTITITGMRNEEGGNRERLNCIITDNGKIVKFHPLVKVDEEWEEWFIKKHNIQLCRLYLPPFNFKRTGCKGCPYSLELNEQLETMALYLPNERQQCEIIWKPIYEEYRRINYRLKNIETIKLL